MKYFTNVMGNAQGEKDRQRLEEALARRRVEIALVTLLILTILFLPLPSTVVVKPLCTHGERLPMRKKTVYRVWWYSPFAPQFVTEVVLCDKHRKEEDEAFEKGVDYYKRGIYPLAISELARVTWPNEKYEEAQFYMRKARQAIVGGERDPSALELDGYEYLLPESFESYRGGEVFKDEAYAAPFLGRSYAFEPPAPSEISSGQKVEPGPARSLQVSLYRFRSASEASTFAQGKLVPVYPGSPRKEKLDSVTVYIGRNAPYYGAVFSIDSFVYEIVAFGTGSPAAIEETLARFSAYLINVYKGTK